MKKQKVVTKGLLSKITTIAIFALVVVFVLGIITPLLAAPLDTGIEYGTFTGLGSQDIRVSIMQIVRIALGFIGVIAIAIIVYAGFVWTTSAGNSERIDFAKRTLRNAVIGLIIILLAFAIVSFIIGQLQNIFGGGPAGGGPPGPCDNCGHLGTGIIESVYPAPWATDVARNTNIIVTFKVQMDPRTIINAAIPDVNACNSTPSNPCQGSIEPGSVIISYQEPGTGNSIEIDPDDVFVSSTDGRTFVFNPLILLGDGINNIWHEVKLTNDIKKDNGDSAFSGRFGTSFTWSFEIGTFLDLDPPEEQSVFPRPDDLGDNYSQAIGVQASGSFQIVGVPKVATVADVTATKQTATPGEIIVNGTYNGNYEGILTLTFVDSNTAVFDWNSNRPDCQPVTDDCQPNYPDTPTPAPPTHPDCSAGQICYDLQNGIFSLGEGIALTFVGPTNGEQWTIDFTPFRQADTLRVANRIYTFVADTAGANEIQVDANSVTLASRIETKINDDAQSPNVLDDDSVNTDSQVDLIAARVGADGNNINFSASSNFISPQTGSLSGGTDSQLVAQVNDLPDEFRNAVIRIDFNEAVNPALINDQSLIVQYDSNPSPGVTDWVNVDGQYFISNQYKTVEFLSNSVCGVCSNSGDPCTDNSQCGFGTCDLVQNSCGDTLFCLPVLADGNSNTTAYDATQYRVVAKAALLVDCNLTGSCNEQNYSFCVETPGSDSSSVCSNQDSYVGDGSNFFYPEAQLAASGIADVANSSFNGNKNTYVLNNQTLGNAQGPEEQSNQSPYNLNLPNSSTQGDDLVWSFFVNKQIKLTPPQITQVGPDVGAFGASLTLPFETDFDSLMFGATLKPGTGYRDGLCGCLGNNDCTGDDVCDLTIAPITGSNYGKCKNPDALAQTYCAEDDECSATDICVNRKYLSLIDRTSAPAGFWISQQGIDVLPQDGYSDYTIGQIQHTRLQPITDYAGEGGSGIKDVYQNCYLPSEGPAGTAISGVAGVCMLSGQTCNDDADCTAELGDRCNATCDPTTGIGCCGVLPGAPYCCNGTALNQTSWEASDCFTGY